jgi:ABC-type antimicrobial peptide transport system permease subunit
MGIALGVLGALGAGSVLGSLLFGVSRADPMTLSGVAALLSVVAALAAALPALRASRVNPVEALHTE